MPEPEQPNTAAPVHRAMPHERQSITHKISLGGEEAYLTVGMYEDGTPGEILLTMAKQRSPLTGVLDSFAKAVSLCLQYGVPLPKLVDIFVGVKFKPAGFTDHPGISYAESIIDYIFKWLALKFPEATPEDEIAPPPANELTDPKQLLDLWNRELGKIRERFSNRPPITWSMIRRAINEIGMSAEIDYVWDNVENYPSSVWTSEHQIGTHLVHVLLTPPVPGKYENWRAVLSAK